MWLKVEPLDVLMFRDSRPFTGGESHRARSIFPPSPLTFQGALRSALLNSALSKYGKTFSDYRRHFANGVHDEKIAAICSRLGTANSAGDLVLTGPLVANASGALVFPVPRDVLIRRGNKTGAVTLDARSCETIGPVCLGPQWPKGMAVLWAEGAIEAPGDRWITATGLREYLVHSAVGTDELISSDVLYQRESRTGIALDRDRRAAETGMLYVAGFVRLAEGAGFVCGAELEGGGDDLLSPLRRPGILQLGGEARACRYYPLEADPLLEVRSASERVSEMISSGAILRLYLASPAVFRRGWLPDFLDPSTLRGNVGGVAELELVAAAVGKPLPVGGWDLVNRRPKPLVQAVPPGSVYLLDVVEGSAEEVVRFFHCTSGLQVSAIPIEVQDQAVYASPKDLARFGFGLTFVGAVPSGC